MCEKNQQACNEDLIKSISDLYKHRLAEAKEFKKMSKDRQITEDVEFIRSHYLSQSLHSEIAASCLAHCVVHFGDVRLDSINFDELSETAAEMSCEGRNPLLWGLNDIKKYLMSQSQ